MIKGILVGGAGSVEDSVVKLSRAIFKGDLTRDQLRSLPSQSLYFALKNLGFESAGDALELITTKQYSALLDFEFWTRDSFREDRFWKWLEMIDDPQNLLPIQRFIACMDPTVLAFIIKRYTEVVYHDEPNDYPPGPNFYTPDTGHTWISIKTHDPERHRLFGKLLAFFYQTNVDFFYRVLMQANEGTTIEFEELGFNEKSKRLQMEDIPSFEDSEPYHRALVPSEVLKNLEKIQKAESQVVSDERHAVNRAIFYSSVRYQPLLSSLEEVSQERLEEIQSEMVRILNCATVFFLNDFGEEGELKILTEQVFGVVNIGLQELTKYKPSIISRKYLEELSYSEVYRVGLSLVYDLRKMAQKIPRDIVETLSHMNEPVSILVECAQKPLPCIPSFFREDGTFEIDENKLSSEIKPITSIQEIESIRRILNSQVLEKSKEIRSYESLHKRQVITSTDVIGEPQ